MTAGQALQQLQRQIQQLGQKLQGIKQKALTENPELQEQQDDFADMVEKKMAELGVNAEQTREKLEKIAKDAQEKAENLTEEQRQAMQKEYTEQRTALQQAQQKVMQMEEVQAAGDALSKALVDGMKTVDESSEQLLAQLNQAQAQYQAIMQQVMQQRAAQQQQQQQQAASE
jgi:chromosome segregation ATPase